MIRLYELECSQRHVGMAIQIVDPPNLRSLQVLSPMHLWSAPLIQDEALQGVKCYPCHTKGGGRELWQQPIFSSTTLEWRLKNVDAWGRAWQPWQITNCRRCFLLVYILTNALFWLKHLIVSAQVPKVCSWFGFHKVQECPARACCHISQRGIA